MTFAPDMGAQADLAWRSQLARHWAVVLGFASMALPLFWHLATGLWQTNDQSYGPMVLAIVAWLFWQQRQRIAALPSRSNGLGWFAVAAALACFVVGRSQSIYLLSVGSFIPLIAGLALLSGGWPNLRLVAFPLVFMLFLIPLPGFVVDSVTGALKQQVSVLAETLLYAAGYPVARTGVVLSVGPYELLVADACSGLNSMFSLFAMGLLYLHMQAYRSRLRQLLLFLAIAPIAFAANVVRVLILVAVTYHFGDAAGQGFIHGFAGIVLFAIALLTLFLFDRLLPGKLLSRASQETA